jgi:hypothetical protein
MKFWLLARSVAHAVVLSLAFCFTPISTMIGIPWFGYSWEDAYIFVWPQVIFGISAFLFDLIMLFRKESRSGIFWWSLMLEPLLIIGWWFPFLLDLWPGGDDGGAHAWLLLFGPACAVSAVVSAFGSWYMYRHIESGKTSKGWFLSRKAQKAFAVGMSLTAGLLTFWVCLIWFLFFKT